MKLKRLEIIGFKSFVDKTIVSFEKEITAIVGPNGCGKSNIVDAIRWVMGEQSPKMLRGKSMDDVIFAGSDSRAPVSMASVELTFSTEGHYTPAAYLNHPEISVCRRLYRTGESEYLINRTAVRLKDIQDLFLGTGVGTRAYSMVEQGRVYQFLSAKPEERRHYIEEAAGISKFKSRKEAALRKMEATAQNLLRLTDLVAELERQMASLDRQAKKAEKYKEAKAEYQKTGLVFLSTLYADNSTRQNEYEGSLRSLSEQEASVSATLQSAENEIELTRFSLSEKEKEINKLQSDLFETTNYVQISETSLRYQKEERERIAQRLLIVADEMKQHRELLEALSQKTALINEQKFQSDLEQEHFIVELSRLESSVAEIQGHYTSLREEVKLLIEKIYLSEGRLNQIGTLKSNFQQKQDEVNANISAGEKELAQSEAMFKETQRIYQAASSSLESLRQLKLGLTSRTDEISRDLINHRDTLKKEEEELSLIKEKLLGKKSRLHSLEELQKNFEGYQEGTRSVLRRKQEQSTDGIFGTIADVVETSPEYEGAVSAVLGEKLQYVVVKSHQEGVEAVEYLKTASSGRSSFIPLAFRSKSADSEEIPQHEGVIGPLKSFVNMKSEYQHLSDFLFGDVVLVSDLKKAIDIWSGNGHRKTLVTLDGEVVDPTGVITGGTAASQSNTLLSMKREIRELAELITQIEIELKDKEFERGALASRVVELEATLEAVKHSSFEEEIRINSQGRDVAQFKKEMDALEAKRQEISERLAKERIDVAKISTELETLVVEENALNGNLQGWKNESSQKKIAEQDATQLFETRQAELTKARIEQAQSAERHIQVENEIKRLQEEQMRLRLELAKREEEEASLNQRQESIAREMQHLEEVIAKKLAVREELNQQFTVQKEEYDRAGVLIAEKELSLKEARRIHDDLTRQINQVTVSLTEVRGDLKRLQEQCLERHQLSLPDTFQEHADVSIDRAQMEIIVNELRQKLSRMGDVNPAALEEYDEIKGRYEFLKVQKDDLQASLEALEKAIQKINRTTKEKFVETFHAVNERFQILFPKLFMGGNAHLLMTDPENVLETGIEVMAQPPGKKNQSINLLSGGEKALTAVSLIFSIFQIRPSPFCILDEVDAPLDEANVGRFNELIREMTNRTQFIVITHNKKSMQMADMLYGVTMQEPGSSQLVSVAMS